MNPRLNSTEQLALWINGLTPRQCKALAMLYLPAGYRVDPRLRRGPEELLARPLGVAVLSDSHALEPLADFRGRILPLCRPAYQSHSSKFPQLTPPRLSSRNSEIRE